MAHSLSNEPADVLKHVAGIIISYQEKTLARKLKKQLSLATLNKLHSSKTIAVFDLPDLLSSDILISRSAGIEARLMDKSGNVLHAMIHIDEKDNLLALEVFPWDEWNDRLDVGSLAPITFDENGISNPAKLR